MDEPQPIPATGRDPDPPRLPRDLHPPTFGALLLRYRLTAGLTQEQLGERAGISARTLNYLEHDTTRPQRETVRLIAEALGLSTAERAAFMRLVRPRIAAPPALAPVVSMPTNLPILLTTLVGRAEAVTQVTALLHAPETRLVTITGPGGIGKTRLGLAVAAACAADYPDGVFIVSLVGLRDAGLVLPTVAQAVGAPERRDMAIFDTLSAALAAKRLLLVLDNCEHLTDAAPEVARLLAACPKIGILATSRAALHVQQERESPLGPLAPASAIALFNERARVINPAFTAETGAVAEICARLEGLPLAIELAAARVRALSAWEIYDRLDDRLGLLTRGARDLPARHQTMREAIAWSHDLLSADERALFRRLAVFAGGWTVAGAEAVCAGDGLTAGSILDAMEGLLDQSLVRAGAVGSDPRLEMYETIREYALEQLDTSGERAVFERQHAAYFLTLAEQLHVNIQGKAQSAARARFESERDNLRAALAWARAEGETTLGLRLAGALGRCWDMQAQYREGRTWLESFLTAPQTDDAGARIRALNSVASLARKQGDYAEVIARSVESLGLARRWGDTAEAWQAHANLGLAYYRQGRHDQAVAALEESVALAQELGDSFVHSAALNNLAQVVEERGEYERALALYERSLSLKRTIDDPWSMGLVLNNVGDLARSMGDQARAIAYSEEGMARGREVGDGRVVANALRNLGLVARDRGDYAGAVAWYEQALALKRDLGDKRGVSSLLGYLGDAHRLMGDQARAAACYAESMALCQAIHNWKTLAECLEGVAGLISVERDPVSAARLLGFSTGMRARMGTPIPPVVREEHARARAALRDTLGTDAFTAAWQVGAAMSPEQAIAEATAPQAPASVTPAEASKPPMMGPHVREGTRGRR